jgi:mercuric ion transport protein
MAIGTKSSLTAGLLAALGASACCAGPLILLLLGVGGGWATHLIALEPYSPYLGALSVLFVGIAFRNLFLRPAACTTGTSCADDRVRTRQRILFCCVGISILLLLTFPLYAPLFY